ncbi:MAG: hypothetical protein LBU85_13505 [Treponema sp.]|jgi:hypothetical protein|nr:hypothetical protein [Treponema sp.]
MNKDSFLRFVADSRDCGQTRLDTAINRGLRMARNDRFDFKKIVKLAAACVFTFLMCITVNLSPFKAAADEYYQNRYKAMPGSAEALEGYMKDIAESLRKIIGEE